MAKNKSSINVISFTSSKMIGIIHEAPSENLVMNKYHILLIIERLMTKPKAPTIEHVLISFAFFVGALLALLPRDFKDFLGIKAPILEASILILVVLSGAITIILLILALRNRSKYTLNSPDQILDDICDQIAKDRNKASQASRKKLTPKRT